MKNIIVITSATYLLIRNNNSGVLIYNVLARQKGDHSFVENVRIERNIYHSLIYSEPHVG